MSFFFILGLESCSFLFYRVFKSFCISYLFCVYVTSSCYLSLKVMLCHILFHILLQCSPLVAQKPRTRSRPLVAQRRTAASHLMPTYQRLHYACLSCPSLWTSSLTSALETQSCRAVRRRFSCRQQV